MNERPGEWLRRLEETPGSLGALVAELGLARSAWTIALARCLSGEIATNVPTRAEVRAAARRLMKGDDVAAVVRDCEALGLLVL